MPRGLFSIASPASLITLPVLFKVTLEVRFQGVRKINTDWDGTGLYVLYVVFEEDARQKNVNIFIESFIIAGVTCPLKGLNNRVRTKWWKYASPL